jgi:hypothetical protein
MLLLTSVLVLLFGTAAFYGYHELAGARPEPVRSGSFQNAGSD